MSDMTTKRLMMAGALAALAASPVSAQIAKFHLTTPALPGAVTLDRIASDDALGDFLGSTGEMNQERAASLSEMREAETISAAAGQEIDDSVQPLRADRQRAIEGQHRCGVEDVLARRTPVNVLTVRFRHGLPQARNQGRNRNAVTFGRRGEVVGIGPEAARGLRDGRRRIPWNVADLALCLRQRRFHLEHGAEHRLARKRGFDLWIAEQTGKIAGRHAA